MALTNAYANEQDLRDHLNDDTNIISVAQLEKALNAVSRQIDKFCGYPLRKFWLDAQPVARRFRADTPTETPVMDIGSTAGIVVRTDDDGDGVFETTWDADDYQLEPLDIAVAATGDTAAPWALTRFVALGDRALTVDWRRPTLQITTRFGWSAIPDDVHAACLLKAARLFRRRDTPLGTSFYADFGVVRISQRDADVMELLHDYVRFDLRAV